MDWKPSVVMEFVRVFETSTSPALVTTDDGLAYAKVLGNNQGPSALVCDYLGLMLARWLGLDTPDVAIVDLGAEFAGVALNGGCKCESGPALLTRALKAQEWSGDPEDLSMLDNPEHLAGLVLLDTWLSNHDRYASRTPVRRNRKNVLFSHDAKRGQLHLVAIDMDQCIRMGGDLTRHCLAIDARRRSEVFGLFPEFAERITRKDVAPFAAKLAKLDRSTVDSIVRTIPRAWLGDRHLRGALAEFCCDRAVHVARGIASWLEIPCKWDPLLFPWTSES